MNAHVRWTADPIYAPYRPRARWYKLAGWFIIVTWLMMAAALAWLALGLVWSFAY